LSARHVEKDCSGVPDTWRRIVMECKTRGDGLAECRDMRETDGEPRPGPVECPDNRRRTAAEPGQVEED
jgi:hypothetical protein